MRCTFMPSVRLDASTTHKNKCGHIHNFAYNSHSVNAEAKEDAVLCTIVPMRRINFYLSEEQVDRLHTVAEQRGMATSELVRRFIDDGLARLSQPQDVDASATMQKLQGQIDELRIALDSLQARLPY
jgi:hypothetical protein